MKIPAIAFIAIAFLLFTAGCTQPATNTTAPIKEIRIGYQPSTHQMAEITAMAKGARNWFCSAGEPAASNLSRSREKYVASISDA